MKKFGISILYTTGTIFILTIVLTILNYFNIINSNVFKLIILIIGLISGSYVLGTKSLKKGYIEGIKFGFLFLAVILILSLIFKEKFKVTDFIYYAIVLSSTMFGSMIGIQRKKKS